MDTYVIWRDERGQSGYCVAGEENALDPGVARPPVHIIAAYEAQSDRAAQAYYMKVMGVGNLGVDDE